MPTLPASTSASFPRCLTVRTGLCVALLSGAALAGTLAIALPARAQGLSVEQENGFLELAQVGLYFVGAFLVRPRSWGALRPLAWLGVLLLVTLALRELDLRKTSAPTWLVDATFHQRHLWLNPLWLGAVAWVAGSWRLVRSELRRFSWGLVAPGLGMACALFLGSYVFDKRWLIRDRATSTLVEECFEVALAVCACLLVVLARRIQSEDCALPDSLA